MTELGAVRAAAAGLVAAALLAGCGALPFRSAVPDVVLDAGTTAGAVCWARGVERSPVRLASATYRANATFDPGGVALGDTLEVALYVRTAAPAAACTAHDAVADRAIAEVFVLEAGVATPVVAGGGGYGAVLAEAVQAPAYWIGARTSGSVALTGDATVRLTDGFVEARAF